MEIANARGGFPAQGGSVGDAMGSRTRMTRAASCQNPSALRALSVLFALQDGPRAPRQPVQDPEELALLGVTHALQQHAIALEGRRHQLSVDLCAARGKRD